jgi:hypothetical protein
VIAVLLEFGADVNALDYWGHTPLDEVETAGKSIAREPVRLLLLAHGAQRSRHDAATQEPLTHA